MAGDWIKIEHATPDKPEVVKIAELLGIDQDAVVGKLMRLWIWADQQTVDGNAMSVTDSFIDRCTFQSGFSSALRKVGWLTGSSGKLSLPNFEKNNGSTAKRRASVNRRVTIHRQGVKETRNAASVTEEFQKALPEKRREEKSNNTPLSPQRGEWDDIFPKGSLNRPKAEQKKIRVLRSNPKMEFIGKWFGRPDTLWTVAEAKALRDLNPTKEEVFEMNRYRNTPNKYHRRDLITLLNNWSGELDRARGGAKESAPSKPKAVEGPEGWREVFRDLIPCGPIPVQWDHVDPGLKGEIISILNEEA